MNFNASNLTMNANWVGPSVDMIRLGKNSLSLQLNWTLGTSTASTGVIECSNDGTTWNTYPNSSTTMGGSPSSAQIEITLARSRFYRFHFTAGGGSGTGTFSALFSLAGSQRA